MPKMESISRDMSEPRRIPELTCTYLLGLYPAGHENTQEEIMTWQSHLVRVAHDTHAEVHSRITDNARETDMSSPKRHALPPPLLQ